MSSNDPIDPETISRTAPTPELYQAIGMVNYAWAELDAISSAALIAMLSVGPIEASIILGRLDVRAKIERIKKISLHRKNDTIYQTMEKISKMIGDEKKLRNAMTHGWYIGETNKGEHLWSLLPDIMVSDNFSGTELYVTNITAISEHVRKVTDAHSEITDAFDPTGLSAIFQLSSHVRSGFQVGTHPQTTSRKTHRRPPQSSEV